MNLSRLAIEGGSPVRKTPWRALERADEVTRAHLLDALESDVWSNGRHVESFERAFAEMLECEFAHLTVNATTALKLALLALDIGPQDEVILPALTFPSVALAVLECGAVPVICDVDPNTYCMSAVTVAPAITSRTRAVLPTHLYCGLCDMPPILELARRFGLDVIEDCAHAPGARRRGSCAGSWGRAAVFSFNQKKILSCGEGGCLVTNDGDLSERVHWLRDFDTAATEPPKRMQRMGKISEFQGAVLLGQLSSLYARLQITQERAEKLREKLERLPGVRVLMRLDGTEIQTFYNFCFRIAHLPDATAFRSALSAELGLKISASYMPLGNDPGLDCSREAQFRNQALRLESGGCPVANQAHRNEAMRFSGNHLYLDPACVEDIATAVEKVLTHFDRRM